MALPRAASKDENRWILLTGYYVIRPVRAVLVRRTSDAHGTQLSGTKHAASPQLASPLRYGWTGKRSIEACLVPLESSTL